MRTKRPNNADEPRHRKAGPARLAGGDGGGRRARELSVDDAHGPQESEEDTSWHQIRTAQ